MGICKLMYVEEGKTSDSLECVALQSVATDGRFGSECSQKGVVILFSSAHPGRFSGSDWSGGS